MRVGIIGGNGFVGSAFVRYFAENGIDHSVITRDNYGEFVGSEFEVLLNANGNSKKFLASENPLEEFKQTVVSVQRSLLDFRYTTYVLCSTIDVYNNVRSPEFNREDSTIDPSGLSKYGLHKLLAETLVRNYAASWLIFRFGGFVGPGLKKNSIYDLVNRIPLRVNIDSAYQYLPTDFAAKAVYGLIKSGKRNQIFNLCGSGVVSLREVIDSLFPGYPVQYFREDPPVERYEVSIEKIGRHIEVPATKDAVTRYVKMVVQPGTAGAKTF